jgi:succinate-acetate transporter protein
MTTGTETRTGTRSGIASASPIGFALFGFALFVFGIRFVSVDSAAAGLNYAILAAAIAETISGLLEIIRGSAYPGYVLTTFGIWLTGLYFLLTVGSDSKIFTPDAVAWYALGLIVPVAYMALPALLHRNGPLVAAFVAILGTLLCLGISETDG